MLAVDRAIVAWAHAAMTTAEGFPEAIRAPPHAVEIAISDRRAHRPASGLRSARRPRAPPDSGPQRDRKSVVQGKGVSVRLDIGGRRIIKKKTKNRKTRRATRNKYKN